MKPKIISIVEKSKKKRKPPAEEEIIYSYTPKQK